MAENVFEHVRNTWDHVISGQSTLGEKVEAGAEAVAGLGLLAVGLKYGAARMLAGREATAASEAVLPELKLGQFSEKTVAQLDERFFGRAQRIQLQAGETGEALHERLRPQVVGNMSAAQGAMKIEMPSWYTFDASKVLGIDNAVAVMTSTCKHETPILTFVGRRGTPWMTPLEEALDGSGTKFRYMLNGLGRELTELEKNKIYDLM